MPVAVSGFWFLFGFGANTKIRIHILLFFLLVNSLTSLKHPNDKACPIDGGKRCSLIYHPGIPTIRGPNQIEVAASNVSVAGAWTLKPQVPGPMGTRVNPSNLHTVGLYEVT